MIYLGEQVSARSQGGQLLPLSKPKAGTACLARSLNMEITLSIFTQPTFSQPNMHSDHSHSAHIHSAHIHSAHISMGSFSLIQYQTMFNQPVNMSFDYQIRYGDGVWYRATVTNPNPRSGHVQVHFVDYGDSEVVPFAQVTLTSDNRHSIPFLFIGPCHLALPGIEIARTSNSCPAGRL